MKTIYSPKAFGTLIGRSTNTLQRWDREGRLRAHRSQVSNRRFYTHDQYLELQQLVGEEQALAVCYWREKTMQQSGRKRMTKALQPPSLMTIQATPNEVIILQAALHHYKDYISFDKELSKGAVPLIYQFIERLHEQLPARKEQRETL